MPTEIRTPRMMSRRDVLSLAGLAAAGALASSGPAFSQTPPAGGGEVIKELGSYLAHTGAKGEILFPNAWGGDRIPLMEQQIKDFNAFYPGIKIQNDPLRAPDLEKKTLSALAGGSPPPVFMLLSNQIPAYVEQNALQPLDDLIARDGLKVDDVFYPGEIATHRYRGKTYSLPNVTAGAWHFVCYHKALLKQACFDPNRGPDTWEDLEKMADAVKAKIPGAYFLEPSHCFSHPAFLVFLYGNAGEFISADMRKVTFNGPEGLETFEWIVQFAKRQARNGKFEEFADRTVSIRDSNTTPVIVSGKYVSAIATSAVWFQVRKTAPDKEFGVTIFPYNKRNPRAKPRTPVHGGWGFVIPRGISGDTLQAAWEWIKYITAGEGNRKFVGAQDRPSPVKAYNSNPEAIKRNPYWSVLLKDFEINAAIPVTGVHPRLLDIVAAMQEEALFEKTPPKVALQKAAEECQKVLDGWWAKQK